MRQQLHYENIAGTLVRRDDGMLRWHCPACGDYGVSKSVRRKCPNCKGTGKKAPKAEPEFSIAEEEDMKIGFPKGTKESIIEYFEQKLELKPEVKLMVDDHGTRIIVSVNDRSPNAKANICTFETLTWFSDTFGRSNIDKIEFSGNYEDGEPGFHVNEDDYASGTYTVWMKE